jgi:hypothetical protein
MESHKAYNLCYYADNPVFLILAVSGEERGKFEDPK